MAKAPEDRYSSCREFVQDAEAALFGRVIERAPGTGNFPTAPNYTQSFHSNTTAVGVVAQHRPPPDQTTVRRSSADSIDQHSLQPQVRRRRGALLAAAGLVTALLVAFGAYMVVGGDKGADSTDLASVRTEHPEFTNKTVAAYDISNSSVAVTLDGSDQAKFLRDIGFRYSDAYQPIGDEKSPRTLQSGFSVSQPIDVVLAIRSDSEAGNGGCVASRRPCSMHRQRSSLSTSPKRCRHTECGRISPHRPWSTEWSPRSPRHSTEPTAWSRGVARHVASTQMPSTPRSEPLNKECAPAFYAGAHSIWFIRSDQETHERAFIASISVIAIAPSSTTFAIVSRILARSAWASFQRFWRSV